MQKKSDKTSFTRKETDSSSVGSSQHKRKPLNAGKKFPPEKRESIREHFSNFESRDDAFSKAKPRRDFKQKDTVHNSTKPHKSRKGIANNYDHKPHPFEKFVRRGKQAGENTLKSPAKKYPNKKVSEETTEVFSADEKQSNEFRLNKYLAHAGVASRRAADELIRDGRVTVNGRVITEMGFKVKPGDEVQFDGKSVNLEKKYYLLFNKPKDCITTVADEHGRKTVMDIIRPAYAQIKSGNKVRLYPVGRLDRNTTGVLLITNDGELAQSLTHPSSEVKKVYSVLLDKKLRKDDFDKIAEGGVVLEDGIAEVDEIAYPNPNNRAEVGVEIHTGKNRFVRRLFEALGYEVLKLDRVYFAGLTKKDLPRGRWRFLSEEEVRQLKHFRAR